MSVLLRCKFLDCCSWGSWRDPAQQPTAALQWRLLRDIQPSLLIRMLSSKGPQHNCTGENALPAG